MSRNPKKLSKFEIQNKINRIQRKILELQLEEKNLVIILLKMNQKEEQK